MIVHFIICLLMCCYFSLFPFPKVPHISFDRVTVLDSSETKNAFIVYIKIKGMMYLIKQKKKTKQHFSAVRDALAAYIARGLNVAHRVAIISRHKDFPGKMISFLPAVLLSYASGDMVRDQPDSIFYNLRLSQIWEKPVKEQGLTHLIINQMTWHWQLPIIIALDLFIGNSDRHRGNLFYNPQTDRFCAIDMDNSFNKNLCALAYEKVRLMMQNRSLLTHEEKQALIKMRNILKYLVKHYSPDKTIKKLYDFARDAGLLDETDFDKEKIKKQLAFYEEIIVQSYMSAYQLVLLLKNL